jgi:hypothetical protein
MRQNYAARRAHGNTHIGTAGGGCGEKGVEEWLCGRAVFCVGCDV